MSNTTNDGAGVTAQARAYLDAHLAVDDHGWTPDDELRLTDLLDAVDAVHAGLAAQLESARRANATLLLDLDRACAQRNRMAEELERVSAELDGAYNKGYDEGFASADDWISQHEDAMAEHGWMRKNKEHVISHATVEVTPHIDWSRMADELDEFAARLRLAEDGDAPC